MRLPIDPARLALVVGLLLALHGGGDPNPTQVAVWLALGLALAVSIKRPLGLTTIALLLVAAVALRLSLSDKTGSDVLTVTKVAIDRMLVGLNPYGYAYQSSNPPGSPFPYGPMALLLYLPFHHVTWLLELLSAFVVAGILAFQGRLLGLAVYATAPILVNLATDGSNDTTLGLLILGAFMTARRWPIGAGFLLACAVAFKLSALAFAPGFFVWGGVRATVMFLAGSIMAWSPVLGFWGLGSFLESARMANDVHHTSRWSIGVIVTELAGRRLDVLDQLRFVVGGVIAVIGLRFRRSMDAVILVGVVVYLATLYLANWATYAYLGGIGAIVCWRLDDWLGFEPVSVPDRVRALRVAWRGRRDGSAASAGTETEVASA